MSICKECQKIFHPSEARYHEQNQRPIRSFFEKPLDCPLCIRFYSDFLRKACRNSDLNGYLEVKRYVNLDVSILEISTYPRRDSISLYVPDYLSYKIFTDEESPLSSVITGRLVHHDGASEAALNRIANSVNKYVDKEPNSVLPLLPTRVIDVENGLMLDHRVRLVASQGGRARYTTLSHCWGTLANVVTTSENQSSRLAGIDIDDMPKTFRDAVTVTRRLGLKYLWIDSICILQRNEEDWEAESPRMGDYYGNSYITIAADCSSDDMNGFLCMRPAATVADVVYADEVRTFELDVGGQMCPLYLRIVSQHVDYGSDSNPIQREPLQRRAWTLQERYVSKHILHFGSNQNYFEDHRRRQIFFEDGRQTENNKLYWPQLYDRSDRVPFRGWYRVIEEYMMRDITDRSDTFPALSGLAQLIGGVSNDTYRAGMWQDDIVRGLLWNIFRGGNDTPRKWKYQSQDYLAPSWSWASASGVVYFSLDYDERVHALGARNMIDRIEQTCSLITVVDCNTMPAGQDPFGRLEGASLTLNAPIFPVQELNFGETAWGEPSASIAVETRAGPYWSLLKMDNAMDVNNALEDRPLYAVFIAYKVGYHGRSSRWPNTLYGLLVERDSKQSDNMFKRLGLLTRRVYSHDGLEFRAGAISDATFDETDRRTIVLV